LTVTTTAADVVKLPAASRATAVSVWLPLAEAVVIQVSAYGALVISVPRLAPSSLNCTPATRTLSDALALTVTAPVSVEPPAGAVIATVGGVVSTLLTFTTTAAELARLPAVSRATAASVWLPLAEAVVIQVREYGAGVISVP